MAKKYLTGVLAVVRQMLDDEFASGVDVEWEDDEITVLIRQCLEELSGASPYRCIEVLTTIANSRILDISSIENLLEVEKLEYPTGEDPRAYRNSIEIDRDTIEIDTELTPDAGGSGTLTGTVTFASGSAAITGSGTAFLTELEAGYHIKMSTGTRWYLIYSVDSDTGLTLAEPCRDTGADTVDATQYCYETVYVYCVKSHALNEETTTLNRQLEAVLVKGVAGRAAINMSRKLINKVNLGGGRVPGEMLRWGNQHLAEFKMELGGLDEARAYPEYGKS